MSATLTEAASLLSERGKRAALFRDDPGRVAAIFAAALYQRIEADKAPLPTFDVEAEAHALESHRDAPVAEAWGEWTGMFDDSEDAAAEVGDRFAYLVAKRAARALSNPEDSRGPKDALGVRDLLDAMDAAEEAAGDYAGRVADLRDSLGDLPAFGDPPADADGALSWDAKRVLRRGEDGLLRSEPRAPEPSARPAGVGGGEETAAA